MMKLKKKDVLAQIEEKASEIERLIEEIRTEARKAIDEGEHDDGTSSYQG